MRSSEATMLEYPLWRDEPIDRRVTAFALVLLVGSWIQFTSAWFWPPVRIIAHGTIDPYDNKPFAVPFQYALWALVIVGVALAWRKEGLAIARRLKMFWPYLGLMILSSILGIWPLNSLRLSVLWLLSVLAGASIATIAPRLSIVRWLAAIVLATMFLSLLMFVLLPEHGSDRYFDGLVLRGVFDNKNTTGRVAALALVVVYAFRHDLGRTLRLTALASAALCLALSDSKAGLVSALLAIGYLGLISILRRRTSGGLAAASLVGALLIGAMLILSFAPFLADLVGRDVTLTGRTLVWEVYVRRINDMLLTGGGPGSFTNVSPLTTSLALELRSVGRIFSPHNFLIGTYGDLGLPGLLYTVGLFGYLTTVLPLRHEGRFAVACAFVGTTTMLHGMGETLDAAASGIGWFLLALFWVCHLIEKEGGPGSTSDDRSDPVTTVGSGPLPATATVTD